MKKFLSLGVFIIFLTSLGAGDFVLANHQKKETDRLVKRLSTTKANPYQLYLAQLIKKKKDKKRKRPRQKSRSAPQSVKLQNNLAVTPLGTAAVDDALHQKLKELKQEVANFHKNRMPTKEHYHRIEKDLARLAEQGAPAEELAAIRQLLEPWNPLIIVEGDKARQAARELEQVPSSPAGGSGQTPSTIMPPAVSSMILPFTIDQISYAGSFVMKPFGGSGGPDLYFELAPGTQLRASAGGRVRARKNPIGRTPEGQPFDPQDWELHIMFEGGYFLVYDHVIGLLVADGDLVQAGQLIARADPASIRHGGSQGQKPVDEFEWGLRRSAAEAVGVCPVNYLMSEEQIKLSSILDNMRSRGFSAPANICLSQEAAG